MKKIYSLVALLYVVGFFCIAHAAYYHMGEADAPKFQKAYPNLVESKLDSCTLCHKGGQYIDDVGNTRTLGTCQWCHYKYGYDGSGDIKQTINPYGNDYANAGRNAGAFTAMRIKIRMVIPTPINRSLMPSPFPATRMIILARSLRPDNIHFR